MKDPKVIYLQPACCAGDEGRLWCEDPDPEDCEDGLAWTRYVLGVEYDQAIRMIESLTDQINEMRGSHD